jgi:hypothetical protein
MEDNKLLIGGIVVIALIIAIPVIGPMLKGSGYDPALDAVRMETLNKAVASYARDNNAYPNTLNDMVPKYLAEVPVTSTNKPFEYYPSTGTIINPAAVAAEQAQGKSAAGTGAGSSSGGISPATDAMTGLSVSEELNF